MRYVSILPWMLILTFATSCEQLTATMSGVSLLSRTPNLADAENMPADLAGALPLNGLGVKVGTAAFVVIVERESATSTAPPTPVSDAQVMLAWDDKQINVCPLQGEGTEGTYQASNFAPPADCGTEVLDYVEDAEYITRIETPSERYTLSVEAPAAIDAARVVFSPPLSPGTVHNVSLPKHPRNEALTVDWSADSADRHAFVTVARIRYDTNGGADNLLNEANWQADPQPVHENFPKGAAEMIDLVTGDPETDEEIPASVFDQKGLYILVLTATELSTDVSTNLFLGSSAMAGAGTAFVFWVD